MESLEWLAIHKTEGRGLGKKKKSESQKVKCRDNDTHTVHLLSVGFLPVS